MHIGEYSFAGFKDMAAGFHGYPAPGILIGGYMVEAAKSRLPAGTLFEALVETPKCLPDAVQLLTLCSTGNNWMKVINLGRYALTLYDKYTGQGCRVSLDLVKLKDWPEIRSWFLKLTPKPEQDTARLFAEIEQAGDRYLHLRDVGIHPDLLGKQHMGEISVCPVCAEAYPRKDGALCRGCQGETPYRVIQEPSSNGRGNGLRLESVPLEAAVGHRALHDMTEIIPGQSKGPAKKAGETISVGDVCRLQHMGRSRVYIHDPDQDPAGEWVHENDAVLAFARRMSGPGVSFETPPEEGKINFAADRDGLLLFNPDTLKHFNLIPDVMCASRQNRLFVTRGKPFAGCRAIPLYLRRERLGQALAVLGDHPLFEVRPLKKARIGVLVTGTEVFQGLIQDRFHPVIQDKVEAFGGTIQATDIVPDDRSMIAAGIRSMLERGIELIITTAGLSVDPDDVTRQGLMDAGLSDILYGAPILPGAMTLLGRIDSTRILGVPACALFFRTTSLDLLLPQLLAEVPISRDDLARLAEGGFCLNCKTCTFPRCPFGK